MSYLDPPEYMPNPLEWLRRMTRVVKGIMQGRTNNYGTFTLTANAGSTVVTTPPNRISIYSVILYEATTANAATEYAAGTMYRSSTAPLSNTFTITHVNNAQTDRIFRYAIIG